MLLRPDGSFVGTLGGGAIELVVQNALREVQAGGEAQYVARELGRELGMCCGGRMEIFVEPIEAPPRLFLCGAGHVAQATAPLVQKLGFEVCVLDERDELNTEARFPGLARVLRDPAEALKRIALGERDWIVIATHDHALDERTLESALRQRPRYIGLMGSRRKVFRLLARIVARRGSVDARGSARAQNLDLSCVYGPVGLALGAVGPEEIAVSIAAELVALRRGREAPHLRAVDHPHLARLLAGEAVPLDEPSDEPLDDENRTNLPPEGP
jgi:xanthine dehydrogenase accessory factor